MSERMADERWAALRAAPVWTGGERSDVRRELDRARVSEVEKDKEIQALRADNAALLVELRAVTSALDDTRGYPPAKCATIQEGCGEASCTPCLVDRAYRVVHADHPGVTLLKESSAKDATIAALADALKNHARQVPCPSCSGVVSRTCSTCDHGERPTLNVNLKPCDCLNGKTPTLFYCNPTCSSQPVLIPCPLPPSVTFDVVLGECTCPPAIRLRAPSNTDVHRNACPARPVKVSCTISGTTWEGSDIAPSGVEIQGAVVGLDYRHWEVCRERWALVKALVTGKHANRDEFAVARPGTPEHFFRERDVVFKALAEMARAEEEALNAQRAMAPFHLQVGGYVHRPRASERPSAGYLQAWVDHNIAQVGSLP